MRKRAHLLAFIFLAAAACEPSAKGVLMTEPAAVPLRAARADASYRLPAHERARVRPGFDVDALERLLGMVAPERRAEILESFQPPRLGEDFVELTYIGDADLQAVLEEVWATYWDRFTLAEIDADDSRRPGKERAKARRQRPSRGDKQ